jgi:hypothetical protein
MHRSWQFGRMYPGNWQKCPQKPARGATGDHGRVEAEDAGGQGADRYGTMHCAGSRWKHEAAAAQPNGRIALDNHRTIGGDTGSQRLPNHRKGQRNTATETGGQQDLPGARHEPARSARGRSPHAHKNAARTHKSRTCRVGGERSADPTGTCRHAGKARLSRGAARDHK